MTANYESQMAKETKMSDKELEQQYEKDLKDLVETYRTLKNIGVWVGKLFAFLLVIATLILVILQILKKRQ